MKKDPYKHKERYLRWKKNNESGISGISSYNSDLILHYLNDMEMGINIASMSVKGSRSYIRLTSLKERCMFFTRKFKEIFNLDKITAISEEQLITFFSDMRNGNIKRRNVY
ncbi:MAG: hypothetical protein WC494_03120 [Candidatus Pacearchaeota archaeon]